MIRIAQNTKPLTTLLLLYTSLLIYASLMPLNFTHTPELNTFFSQKFWNQWPFIPDAKVSRSDLLSNLVIYIPFGFLFATRMILSYSRSFFSIIILPILICALLSLFIETLQSGIGIRVPSATDWLLNCFSSAIGAVSGLVFGRRYYEKSLLWLKNRWTEHPLDIISLTLLFLVCADSLAPFLPTIKLSQIGKSLKRSHFDILQGFAQHPWHWWLIVKLQIYHILALLLVFWNRNPPTLSRRIKVTYSVAALALLLECVKPMIATRQFNTANLVAAATGASLCLLTGPIVHNKIGKKMLLNLAMGSLLLYLLYLAWTPFNFVFSFALAKQKMPSDIIELLPLYHYAMGASLEHVRLFIQNSVLAAFFIYLARLRFARFEKSRALLFYTMLICLALGITQEGGQLFLPGRTPSMTDIYCFMLGGYLGAKAPVSENI